MKKQTIFRTAHQHGPYSQLGNSMLQDLSLSSEARGMLAHILSLPPDWQFSERWYCQKLSLGHDRVRRMLLELIAAGYCTRTRERAPNGTFDFYEYAFTDAPLEHTAVAKPATGQTAPDSVVTNTKKEIRENRITKINLRDAKLEIDEVRPPTWSRGYVSEKALDQVRYIAPGWDRQALLAKFMEWEGSSNAKNIDAAFLGWIKSFTKGKRP